jgi:predicted Zn-ribbon and HTH transcriptional regulator
MNKSIEITKNKKKEAMTKIVVAEFETFYYVGYTSDAKKTVTQYESYYLQKGKVKREIEMHTQDAAIKMRKLLWHVLKQHSVTISINPAYIRSTGFYFKSDFVKQTILNF